jgi:hypothetical protein
LSYWAERRKAEFSGGIFFHNLVPIPKVWLRMSGLTSMSCEFPTRATTRRDDGMRRCAGRTLSPFHAEPNTLTGAGLEFVITQLPHRGLAVNPVVSSQAGQGGKSPGFAA